ncbi:BrxA/BrxB family bacilliredoxin, partial [Staphylococcus aureus]|uniref:BrxA/BrxB family bacilliredoxin n=1 Tax=Staphylococcus aureus TaxID=1280 RepID=UPI00210E55F7
TTLEKLSNAKNHSLIFNLKKKITIEKITEMIERHQIEGHDVMNVSNQLQTLFNKYCEER